MRLLACNVGMTLGAIVAEALVPWYTPVAAGLPASVRMLLAMAAGMTAGTWCGEWCAERVLDRWRRGWDAC